MEGEVDDVFGGRRLEEARRIVARRHVERTPDNIRGISVDVDEPTSGKDFPQQVRAAGMDRALQQEPLGRPVDEHKPLQKPSERNQPFLKLLDWNLLERRVLEQALIVRHEAEARIGRPPSTQHVGRDLVFLHRFQTEGEAVHRAGGRDRQPDESQQPTRAPPPKQNVGVGKGHVQRFRRRKLLVHSQHRMQEGCAATGDPDHEHDVIRHRDGININPCKLQVDRFQQPKHCIQCTRDDQSREPNGTLRIRDTRPPIQVPMHIPPELP